MDKKKILIVLYYYDPYVSGVSVYAKRLATELVEKGHKVRILTTCFKDGLPRFEIVNGVEIQRCAVLFSAGKGVISPELSIRAIRLSYSFDVVNYHLPFAEAGLAMLFMPRRKIFTTYQCDINLGRGFLNTLIEKLSIRGMWLALFLSRKIIVLSIDYFQKSKMNYFIYKAVEVSPPITTSDFEKQDISEDILSRFGVDLSTYKIGFVGRIVFEKGIQYLLEAIPIIEREMHGREFIILIAGDYTNIAGGSIKKELDVYLEKYPQRIRFTGFLSEQELVQFYSLIDVLVLPSIDPLEAFGMVQIEAMCCGCPVIASDMPGVRVPVTRTNFGYLVPIKNPQAIADKIIMTIESDLRHNTFKRTDWDSAMTAEKYIQLFKM